MPFRLANVDDRAVLVVGDDYHDVERASGGALPADPMAVLSHLGELSVLADSLGDRDPDGAVADVVLGSPVPRPRNVFAIGLNYVDHAAESGVKVPEVPLVFTKWPSCIVGPTADVDLAGQARVDHEVELVVVIGRAGKGIAAADAWDHIAGCTIGQDISDRDLQMAAWPPHFDMGKSRDTFGPMGPWLVSTDSFSDPDDLALQCTINGDVRQDDRTKSMVFDVRTLVEYISDKITLEVGDVIFTGTPAGVGLAGEVFLKPGDEIVSTIEGIGELRNRCV